MITFKRLFFMTFLLSSLFFAAAAWGQDFGVNIDRIYYQDNSGREIDYNFSTGEMDQYGVVTIPSSAVTAPASESSTTFLWGQGFEAQYVSLSEGVYQIAIPQATDTIKPIPAAGITVDGSEADWAGVAPYIEDRLNYVAQWVPAGSGADMQYVKLAFSPDNSKLYILMKLNGIVSQDTWYRLFLDKDLDGRGWRVGDYQIDIQYNSNSSSWEVVSQGWNSDGSWYAIEESGVVAVSGQVVEASVSTAAFGLPADAIITGRTMQNEAPYRTYDTFSNNYLESEGFCSMGGSGVAASPPTEWQFVARLSNFRNVSQIQHYYGVCVGAGSSEHDDLEPYVCADWFTGTHNGVSYRNALVFGVDVGNDLEGADEYDWEWCTENGGGLVLTGLDPDTTVLDLKIVVTNTGQTVSAYYRISSDVETDWNLLVTHTLPAGVGTIYGFPDIFPCVELDTGMENPLMSKLLGTWGHQILGHWNDGTWHTEANKTTLNSDNTGILEYKFNDNGTFTSGTENFTYTVDSNADGSLTLWYTKEGETSAEPSRLVLSDDGKMMIVDGTDDLTRQELEILIKLDTTKTHTNSDLSGYSYMIGYEHDAQGGDKGYYRASSGISSSDGAGNLSFTAGTLNGDGALHDISGQTVTYTVNSDGSVVLDGTGYLSGKLFMRSNPDTATDDWENNFAMAKGDRAYATADLAGTWAIVGFGDDNGTSFNAEIGDMIIDANGNFTYSFRNQRDGVVTYESRADTWVVSEDGSFGSSFASGAPYYAGAIGNDGNTIIFNVSFDESILNHREIFIGVRCDTCLNLAGVSQTSPQEDLAFNTTGSGYPSPFESDSGWGGGTNKWQIVDGNRTYPGEWARGLAFTGGTGSCGGEACGWRQSTIDFGEPKTFNRIVVWHHGLEHVPNTYKIQYWDGANWVDIFSTTNGHSYLKYSADSSTNWWESWSTPTENTFDAVTSSKVKFALNNCDIIHGWIYEFEVYHDEDGGTPSDGDINNDGTVGLADAILGLQVTAGMNPAGIRSDYATSGADVNADGKIGLAEVIYILQYVAGLR